MTFRDATAVKAVDDNRWSGRFAENWDIVGKTNGGYMLAIASRASSEAVEGRTPVSVTGHYTRPGHTGPVDIETEVVRSGRRLSVVRSRSIQDDAIVLETLGSFAVPNQGEPGILLSDATPPDLPPPEQCVRAVPAVDGPFPPPSVGQVDMRFPASMAVPFSEESTGEALVQGWFRLKDGESAGFPRTHRGKRRISTYYVQRRSPGGVDAHPGPERPHPDSHSKRLDPL